MAFRVMDDFQVSCLIIIVERQNIDSNEKYHGEKNWREESKFSLAHTESEEPVGYSSEVVQSQLDYSLGQKRSIPRYFSKFPWLHLGEPWNQSATVPKISTGTLNEIKH